MKTLLTSTLLFIMSIIYSQEEWITMDAGTYNLPVDKVSAMLEASNGDIYVSYYSGVITDDGSGFARYSGSAWTFYDTSNSDLPSNKITSLAEAPNGDIYIGTIDKQLALFDGTNITHINPDNSDSLFYVRSLLMAEDSTLYVGTDNQLVTYKGSETKSYNTYNSNIPADQSHYLLEDKNGNIYIGNDTMNWNGLIKYDGQNWQVFTTSNSDIPADYLLSPMSTDINGNLYMASFSGLGIYDGNSWTRYSKALGNMPESVCYSVMPTLSGNFIYAGLRSGLTKYDGTNWTTFDSAGSKASLEKVYYMMRTSNEDIWMASENYDGLIVMKPNDTIPIDTSIYISGEVYLDDNLNGTKDMGEASLKGHKVKLLPNNIYSYTNSEGEFYFNVDTGDYTVELITDENWEVTSDSQAYNVAVTTSFIDTLAFGINPTKEVTDISVLYTSSPTRCGFTVQSYLNLKNNGTSNEEVEVQLYPDSSFELAHNYPEADTIAGDSSSLTWQNISLDINEEKQFLLRFTMPGVDFMGDTLVSYASISNSDGFIYWDTLISVLTCSYDPNDKLVDPIGVTDKNLLLHGTKLDYTIRFQNTGTDTAFNILITDTLDSNLDINSFKLEANSHEVDVTYDSLGNVSFAFNNILLPDSIIDEPNSHGFVRYSIMPKEGLSDSSVVNNKAYIYFDFNPPIITNETYSMYVSSLPKKVVTTISAKLSEANEVTVVPNPFSTEAKVRFNNPEKSKYEFRLYDVNGKLVNIISNTTDEITIQRDVLKMGMYFYTLKNLEGTGYYSGKVLVK